MSQLSRFAPPTLLDALRRLLADFSEADRQFPAQFERSLVQLGPLAIHELGQRLARAATPMPLRRRILQACRQSGWPEWDAYLVRMLLTEAHLGLFDEGCAALGGLGTHRALSGLQRLQGTRRDPERQAILERELAPYQAAIPRDRCLEAMAQRENLELALAGARAALTQVGAESLPDLLVMFRRGNATVCRSILRVLVYAPWGSEAMVALFQEVRTSIREIRSLLELVPQLQGGPRETLKEQLLVLLEERNAEAAPDLVPALKEALAGSAGNPTELLEALKAGARGALDAFLLKALGLQLEGKALGTTAHLAETLASVPALEARASEHLGEVAAYLAARIEAGMLPLETGLSLLEEAMLARLGGDELAIAYLRLLPPDDRPRLDRLLNDPDAPRRRSMVERLGAREEDRLVPFFLKAMNDPDREVGQLAIHQIGKLPSGFKVMMEFFRSEQLDRMREAIRFFHENRAAGATKALMGFLSTESPDELLVDAARALGALRNPVSASAMLNQLHSGKPLALQEALADSLGALASPAASLGLLKKSEELTFPSVLLLSLKGSLSAFPGFDQPFPVEQIPALEKLARRCCDPREGAGHWMATADVLLGLFTFDQGLYERLADGFDDFLREMRMQTAREREQHEHVLGIVKQLSRRGENLGNVEAKEAEIRGHLEAFPEATGSKRLGVLYKIREILADPWVILGVPFATALAAFVRERLGEAQDDPRTGECLAEMAGFLRRRELIEPLRDLYGRTERPPVKAAVRKALLDLGLPERELERRVPIKKLLILEPNAFFRKRLLLALEGKGRPVEAVALRTEAERLLEKAPVDLLVTEIQDSQGDLGPWLQSLWEQRKFRYALLSTASPEIGDVGEKSWVLGKLSKPYPLEELIQILEG